MTIYSYFRSLKLRVYFLFFVMTTFLALFIYIILKVFFGFGFFAVIYATLFAVLFNVFVYANSPKIILSLYNAQPLPDRYHYVEEIVEKLAIGAGLEKVPEVYLVPYDFPNAFTTGSEKNAIICVTYGLLELLNEKELEGVLAHEIGHIKNKDVWVMTVASVLAGIIVIIIEFIWRWWWLSSFYGSDREREISVIDIILLLLMLILAPIIATLIKLAISRQREYLADAFAAYLTKNPDYLISALKKIASWKGEVHYYRPTECMFIFPPSLQKAGESFLDWLDNLFSTHPPIEERIKRLEMIKYGMI